MRKIKWNLLSLSLFLSLCVTPSFAADKPAPVKRVQNYIAVFDLEVVGRVDKDVARPLSDSIRREIIKAGKYEVIDRSNMDKILKEQSFQMTGCTQKDCAVEAGQMLGVGKIVIGTISIVGQTYYLSLSMVNVETGKTEMVEEDTCRCEIDELLNSSKRAAGKLMGTTGAQNDYVGGADRNQAALSGLDDNKSSATIKPSVSEPAHQRQVENKKRNRIVIYISRTSGSIDRPDYVHGGAFDVSMAGTTYNLGYVLGNHYFGLNATDMDVSYQWNHEPGNASIIITDIDGEFSGSGFVYYYQGLSFNDIITVAPGLTIGGWEYNDNISYTATGVYDLSMVAPINSSYSFGAKLKLEAGYKHIFFVAELTVFKAAESTDSHSGDLQLLDIGLMLKF